MPRNSKITALALLPLTFFVFLLGWTLVYFSSNKMQRKIKAVSKAMDSYNLEFSALPPKRQRVPMQ